MMSEVVWVTREIPDRSEWMGYLITGEMPKGNRITDEVEILRHALYRLSREDRAQVYALAAKLVQEHPPVTTHD